MAFSTTLAGPLDLLYDLFPRRPCMDLRSCASRFRAGIDWSLPTRKDRCESRSYPRAKEALAIPKPPPPNPSPEALGVTHGVGFASLPGWVVMKLVAGREKDRYHLIEVLKQSSDAQIAEVVVRLRSIHPSYLAEFHRLVRAAEDGSQENW